MPKITLKHHTTATVALHLLRTGAFVGGQRTSQPADDLLYAFLDTGNTQDSKHGHDIPGSNAVVLLEWNGPFFTPPDDEVKIPATLYKTGDIFFRLTPGPTQNMKILGIRPESGKPWTIFNTPPPADAKLSVKIMHSLLPSIWNNAQIKELKEEIAKVAAKPKTLNVKSCRMP